MPRLNVKVNGLKELRKDVKSDALLQAPYKRMMENIGKIGQEAGEGGAPRLTGFLQSQMAHKVPKSDFPASVTIKNTAERKGNRPYFYGVALEYGRKWGHFGWFSKAIEGSYGRMGDEMDDMGKAAERAWKG